ncbi:hypothetical protein [Flavobacterium sp. S87F.05.LMB.W.Kidney.N]|uniref:hypothetical protein n=1 Tax=Flavobacterium sp. S87F.05.LMB.W.Kidney.N TaxID=1278758 RepID=UPI0010654740|nr:hypothetical protein [Flavobacterium sp. S87F.05.LMB.W.Kidney.N]TDX09824.1 hypothetical protein EDB96_3413 [Flavobacterium sp. S87F.05.LMB.W.Kidney.N]
MWSDRYNYYNIQSNLSFSEKIDSKIVIDTILNTKCFFQKGNQNFSNAEHFPWLDLVLVEADEGGFITEEKEIPFINLIAIVCSKGINIDQSIYIETFLKIAKDLNWKLYLEEDDYGNEDIEIT